MKSLGLAIVFGLLVASRFASAASAGTGPSLPDNAAEASTRYGPLNLFDSRSDYGQGTFPEPFLVDDSDHEDNEARFDWFHSEGPDTQTDMVKAELEKGVGGLVTLEVEVPYEWDRALTMDPSTGVGTQTSVQGFGNVSVGARTALFQYVSTDGFFNNTFGTAIEVGIPVNSPVSKNTEVVPKIFDDLAVGRHFTIQTVEGYSQVFGSQPDGNLETFEYGFVFGWTIHHEEFSLPAVEEIIPVFELRGNTQINKDRPGFNSLLGNAAVRFNMATVGPVQPRLGIGYVFPIDKGARDDFHWGIYTSLIFEY